MQTMICLVCDGARPHVACEIGYGFTRAGIMNGKLCREPAGRKS